MNEEKALVPYDDTVEVIPGLVVTQEMTFAQKKALIARGSQFISQPTESVDEYLNVPIACVGIIMHPCTVRSRVQQLDRETGEVYYPYLKATRTLFLRADGGKAISFVAKFVDDFVTTWILPVFGNGIDKPWESPLVFKFKQVPTHSGRTYNVTLIEE